MPTAIRAITRLQDADDGPGVLGAGDDEKYLQWDNDAGAFIMAAAAGGGTPGGSTTQVQFNNAGAFGGAAGFIYQAAASPNVTIQAQNAAYVPLVVKAAASQSANLQEWQISTGAVKSFIDATGRIRADLGTSLSNVFIGSAAGNYTGSGVYNLGIGANALMALTTGGSNMAFGALALTQVTTGIQNVAIGAQAMQYGTSPTYCIGIGSSALAGVSGEVGGTNNIAIGRLAGYVCTTGSQNNVFIGVSSGQSMSTGDYSVFIGNEAGKVCTGIGNTLLGYRAGANLVAGNYNVCLGYYAGYTALTTESNRLYIANAPGVPLIYGEFDTGFIAIHEANADTNIVHNLLYLRHNSSGTPAAGFGTGLQFQGHSSTTIDQDMAQIATRWSEATHATRKAQLVFNVYDTAAREALRLGANGSAATIGFFGATPVVQQTKTAHNDWTNISDVVDALVSLGLFDAA